MAGSKPAARQAELDAEITQIEARLWSSPGLMGTF